MKVYWKFAGEPCTRMSAYAAVIKKHEIHHLSWIHDSISFNANFMNSLSYMYVSRDKPPPSPNHSENLEIKRETKQIRHTNICLYFHFIK